MEHTQEQLLTLLRQAESLQSLPDKTLIWLLKKGETKIIKQEDTLFERGDKVDNLHILLEGRIKINLENNGKVQEFGVMLPGDITGVLPYSRMKEALGYGRAVQDTLVFSLHKSHFQEMIMKHQDLVEVLVHHMLSRVKNFTAIERQNEKMMALGKLSAGLAHELNNPAAAIIRSAEALKKHLGHIPERFKKVIKIKADDKQVDFVNHLMHQKIQEKENMELSLLEKTELEEEITDWLDDNDLSECATELAETFTEFGFTMEDLEKVADNIRQEDLAAVLQWIESNLQTEGLVQEIQEASSRISNLVNSVKSYTHMDRAPEKCAVDLRVGIKNTLTILQHKIKKHNIQIIKNIPEDFPKVTVFENEMNQVWTNIFDNAIDAMEDTEVKELKIDAFSEDGFAKIDIQDSGTGIPDEIKNRIFDPFFTTKEVGKGSGMGLETVMNIMRHHNGKISLLEKDNHTVFQVCLPLELK